MRPAVGRAEHRLPDQRALASPLVYCAALSSAAELEGKTVVMSETSDHSQRYRPPGDKRPPQAVSEAEIRGHLQPADGQRRQLHHQLLQLRGPDG